MLSTGNNPSRGMVEAGFGMLCLNLEIKGKCAMLASCIEPLAFMLPPVLSLH